MKPDATHFQMLLDSQCTVLIQIDAALRINYLNAAAETLFHTSRRKLITTYLPGYFQQVSRLESILSDCFNSGHPVTCHELLLKPSEMVGETAQCVDLTVTRLSDDDQGYDLLLEVQPVNYVRRHSRDESWQQAHLVTRQLVRGVAHELKNPLGGIRGAAQLLLSDHLGSDWQECLGVIVDESDRLTKLANQLLGMNRLPEKQWTNVHECLERARLLVQKEQPQLRVVCDYDPSIPECLADRNMLIQSFLNLVRNAMQALLEHQIPDSRIVLRTRIRRQLTIHARRYRLAIQVDIEDNGPGIPPGLRDGLFFPMVTGRAEGTGLGLAITQDIISQHDGVIECDSKAGYTRFRVLLPIAQVRGG